MQADCAHDGAACQWSIAVFVVNQWDLVLRFEDVVKPLPGTITVGRSAELAGAEPAEREHSGFGLPRQCYPGSEGTGGR